jgi:hypothetical protein
MDTFWTYASYHLHFYQAEYFGMLHIACRKHHHQHVWPRILLEVPFDISTETNGMGDVRFILLSLVLVLNAVVSRQHSTYQIHANQLVVVQDALPIRTWWSDPYKTPPSVDGRVCTLESFSTPMCTIHKHLQYCNGVYYLSVSRLTHITNGFLWVSSYVYIIRMHHPTHQ